MTAEPAGTELTGFVTARQRAGRQRRATLLRGVAGALLLLAVLAGAGWAVAAPGGGPGSAGWWLGLAASVLCPAVVALVAYAAARVARREATERMWLAGSTLVTLDEVAGRKEYDLAAVPVELRLRSLLTRAGPRPVWAELHIGADPVDRRVLALTDRDTRQGLPAAELSALAAALDHSPHPGARLAAGRLRTLARWGGLAPLRGTDTEDLPVTPADGEPPVP